MQNHVVIMAGGIGSRFWPMSVPEYPKQFIDVMGVGKSLIQNTGFDGSGTNCGGGGLYDSTLWQQPLPVTLISPTEENQTARKEFERYYHQTNCFWAKAIRRIKRTLKGDFGA